MMKNVQENNGKSENILEHPNQPNRPFILQNPPRWSSARRRTVFHCRRRLQQSCATRNPCKAWSNLANMWYQWYLTSKMCLSSLSIVCFNSTSTVEAVLFVFSFFDMIDRAGSCAKTSTSSFWDLRHSYGSTSFQHVTGMLTLTPPWMRNIVEGDRTFCVRCLVWRPKHEPSVIAEVGTKPSHLQSFDCLTV